jgi:predicted RNA-binding protein with TRAM domain
MEYERRERRGGYGRGGGYGRREGGGGYGSGFPPKPVEIGKEYDVEIQETSRRGEGIARIKGLVVFVPNTKPGDKVKIRVTRISRRFCEAEVVGAGEPKAEEETSETTTEEETSEATTEEETETSTENSTESSTETDTETDTEDETESDTESM